MSVWLWVLAGLAAYLGLAVLVTLSFGIPLARLRHAREEESSEDWTVAPLTRERRRSAERAADQAATTNAGAPDRRSLADALRRGDLGAANAATEELDSLALGDALAVCVVLAERDAARYRLAAPRWLSRFVAECGDVSLEEAQLVQAALGALPSAPLLARPVLRELVASRGLVTVPGVFDAGVFDGIGVA